MKKQSRFTSIRKKSISLKGHRTSISLEPEFFETLKSLAASNQVSLNEYIARIEDEATKHGNIIVNLSSAIRVHCLKTVMAA